VVIVVQDSQSIPGVVTDSLGNLYRQVAGQASHTSALGYAAYLCQVTTGGNRPILSFNLAASGMMGLRGYTGVSLATGFKGHPVAPSTVTMNDQDGSHLPYATDGDAQSVGDLVLAFIMTMNGTATFASNPMSSPGWNVVTTTQGNGISLQLLEQSPAATRNRSRRLGHHPRIAHRDHSGHGPATRVRTAHGFYRREQPVLQRCGAERIHHHCRHLCGG
jgi:hypothetical protein